MNLMQDVLKDRYTSARAFSNETSKSTQFQTTLESSCIVAEVSDQLWPLNLFKGWVTRTSIRCGGVGEVSWQKDLHPLINRI